MKVEDLGTRLGRLVDEATAEAPRPEVREILSRGRRRRQRRRAGAVLAAAALVALVVMVPAGVLELPDLAGTPDRAPADRAEGSAEGETPTGYPGFWYGKIDASVYLRPDVSDQQRAALRDQLESLDVVHEIRFESSEEAYAHFSEQFAGDSELLENVAPESMPESFRVLLDRPSSYGLLQRALCPPERAAEPQPCGPAIEAVTSRHELLRPMLGEYWPDRTDVTVFLAMDAGAELRASIQARLVGVPLVTAVFSESPAEAARRAPQRIRDAVPEGRPLVLPPSFRVSLRAPATGETAESFLDAFCASRRTGDCAPGVAMVMLHPRGELQPPE